MQILYSFGQQPVAGYLDKSLALAKNAPRFENAIAICTACALVQQASDESKHFLLTRVYPNYQPTYSMSEYVRFYLESFLDFALEKTEIKQHGRVIEVGSNDGLVINMLRARGFDVFGFDPSADNSLNLLNSGRVIRDFFGLKPAQIFVDGHGKANLLISRHTLEHVWDPLDFLKGVSVTLGPKGIAVIEVPYLPLQIMNNQFQSMTFQHVSFFSLISLKFILEKVGLCLLDFTFSEMDAGSIIIRVGKEPLRNGSIGLVDRILDYEKAFEVDKVWGYKSYFGNLHHEWSHIKRLLQTQIRRGIQVVAYGAGSKGQAILNMLDIERDLVEYVIDDTPGYTGQFVPGVGTEVIVSTDHKAQDIRLIFITAPTHVQEIVRKERHRAAKGTSFIVSVPGFHFVVPKGV
jgi:SAM-dependent methyltransferase